MWNKIVLKIKKMQKQIVLKNENSEDGVMEHENNTVALLG